MLRTLDLAGLSPEWVLAGMWRWSREWNCPYMSVRPSSTEINVCKLNIRYDAMKEFNNRDSYVLFCESKWEITKGQDTFSYFNMIAAFKVTNLTGDHMLRKLRPSSLRSRVQMITQARRWSRPSPREIPQPTFLTTCAVPSGSSRIQHWTAFWTDATVKVFSLFFPCCKWNSHTIKKCWEEENQSNFHNLTTENGQRLLAQEVAN